MRFPILTVLPAQETLRAAAMATSQGRSPKPSLRRAALPAGFKLDLNFPAIPVGSGRADSVMSELAVDASQAFVVRGFIEAESIEKIPEKVDGQDVFSDPEIAPFLTCGGSPAVGRVVDVANKLQLAALAAKGLDGQDVAIAIMDTGINLNHLKTALGKNPRFDAANSWTPPGVSTLPGRYPVDHGTMCAFDALIAAPNATLLDFPILAGSAPGGSVVGRTLGTALRGFSDLLTKWAVTFATGGVARYRALVVSNSWGMYHPSWDFPVGHRGRYIDNPNHPFSAIVGALVNSGVDIVFAAGNCGSQCADGRCQSRTTGTIMGANAYQDVLTVAGCDTNDDRVGYSSQGPSITGMFQQKPDLMCYTHFLGSQAFGAGSPDSGTSAACPVAAGCIAALRTKESPFNTPSRNLLAQLNTTARPVAGQTGWTGDHGSGILDPLGAATSLGL